jgi:hypothetical protein
MLNQRHIQVWILCTVAAPALLTASLAAAQGGRAERERLKQATASQAAAPTDPNKELGDTQDQLLNLLRVSPTLTSVVAIDPSLLSNREYVARNNPALAQFLAKHPEITRNPEFYLFSRLGPNDRHRDRVRTLERAIWPEYVQGNDSNNSQEAYYHDQAVMYKNQADEAYQRISSNRTYSFNKALDQLFQVFIFACVLGTLFWLVRSLLEGRRRGQIARLQLEMHNRLIQRMGSSQELMAYLESDIGKRLFLDPPSSSGEGLFPLRLPNLANRVLTTLQIGVVLVLIGLGLFGFHVAFAGMPFYMEWEYPIMVLNYLTMIPGLGFILFSCCAWLMAGRPSLRSELHATPEESDSTLNTRERP